jgi:hypothetical protein
LRLPKTAQFQDCAELSSKFAAAHGDAAARAVSAAWENVGLAVKVYA